MRKLKLFGSCLLMVSMLFHSVPAKADPPPTGVYQYTDPVTGEIYVWNSRTNRYEKKITIPLGHPNPVQEKAVHPFNINYKKQKI